jgi:hypothetical protein
MKILILGHARHGKDTLAGFLKEIYGLTFRSSSALAAELFLFDTLNKHYGFNYKTVSECFEDRLNHRALWRRLIAEYNTPDKARLAKEILSRADMYVGMRANDEVEECQRQSLFNWIIGVYDPRKPKEPSDSFNVNIWEKCDIVIPNAGTVEHLRHRVINLWPIFVQSANRNVMT